MEHKHYSLYEKSSSRDLQVGDTILYHTGNVLEVLYLSDEAAHCYWPVKDRFIRLNRSPKYAPHTVRIIAHKPIGDGRFNPNGLESRFMIDDTFFKFRQKLVILPA